MRAGVIGLGQIGTPMAQRVLERGFALAVRDVREEAERVLGAAGATVCASSAAVAARSDVICIAVLDDAQLEAVMLGPGGIREGAHPGLVVGICSTVREATVLRLAETMATAGVDVIDAGVAGGYTSAETATLVTLVGGDTAAVERARPVLDCFSKQVIHAGALGAGMRLKLVKNAISYLAMIAGHEGQVFAQALGIAPEIVRQVVDETHLVDQFFHFGLGRERHDRLSADASADALGHARHYAEVARKDLAAAEELARTLGVELPHVRTARENAGRLFLEPDEPTDRKY